MKSRAEKLTLLRELLAVSKRQTGLLKTEAEADIAESLSALLEQRDSLINAIDKLDARHTAAEDDVRLQAEIREVLIAIQKNDEENRVLLETAMQGFYTDIVRLRGARKQMSAYGDAPIPPGQMFDSKQ